MQRHLLHTDFDIDALAPIAPEELARAVEDPPLREQLINGLCAMTLCGERVEERELLEVERFAAALGARPHAVRQLHHLYERRLLLLRIDISRSSLLGKNVRRMLDEGGLYGLARNVASFAGILENEPVAARYRSLEGYSEGTLGKALFTFYRENGFSFPGEKRGVPEGVLTHDLSHILAGYGTDLRGEAMTIAFQAGYRRENPFGILVFLLVQLQQGIQLTVLAPSQQGDARDARARRRARAIVRSRNEDEHRPDGRLGLLVRHGGGSRRAAPPLRRRPLGGRGLIRVLR